MASQGVVSIAHTIDRDLKHGHKIERHMQFTSSHCVANNEEVNG